MKPTYTERLRAQERFYLGCRAALDACTQPGPQTDAEHNDLARRLGRPDLERDLQPTLILEPPSCA